MTINDLIPGVVAKLAGHSDAQARAPIWIKDAILELTESYPFEELKTTGPVVNFTVNQVEYDLTFFTNNNELPTMVGVWYVSNTTTMPVATVNSGNTGRYLKYRNLPLVRVMSKTSGVPSKWCRNGKKFLIGQAPSQGYATQMDYQKTHPFLCSLFDPIMLCNQTIQMPDSWSIILEFAAATIGAYELRMLDYGQMYHNVIYGDPEFQKTGKGNPGLIFSRTSNYDRDNSNNERQLQMVVLKSCG